MAKLGIHKKGHGLEKLYGSSVSHHKAKDLFKDDGQMNQHPMTSEVHPDISSLAGPDMSNQASTAGAPYMGGNSVDSSGTTAAAGFKKGGRVHYAKGSVCSERSDCGQSPYDESNSPFDEDLSDFGFKKGGMALKKINKEKNPGLSKLPKEVRHKMGYMKKGGKVKK